MPWPRKWRECYLAPGSIAGFFSRVYGPFTIWLNGRGLGDEFEPLRDFVRCRIFASFVVRRGILVLGKPSLGGDRREVTDDMALNDMPEDLLHLIRQRGLAYLAKDGKWLIKGFVTSAMVDALRRELSELVNMEIAARLLGLPQAAVLMQIEAGALAPRLTMPSGDFLFDCGTLRSWRQLAAVNEAGLLQRFDDRNNTALTLAEVAKRLKITLKTAFYLAQNGFLGADPTSSAGRAGTAAAHITSVVAFEDVFVSIGQLAALAHTPQGALAIRLRNAGVAMVAMPPGLSRIYWRHDIRAFGLPQPDLRPFCIMNASGDAVRPSLLENR